MRSLFFRIPFRQTDIATRLEDKIHEVFSGVVLFVDKDSRYFPTVKINHYKPYKKLIDHLIEVHHYSDIMFLGGWKNHVHSIQREQAYRDSLTEHGIPVDPNNIYYGNYWYDSGKEVVKLILIPERNFRRRSHVQMTVWRSG